MAKQLIIEFPPLTDDKYQSVNAKLGVDATTGRGDWPPGLRSHRGGRSSDGHFFVVEVWDSQEAQDEFMKTRLGPALEEVKVPPPVRVTWIDLITDHVIS